MFYAFIYGQFCLVNV